MTKILRSINPSEHQMQCAIVKYANSLVYKGRKIGDYLFAIPNGGYRNKFEAKRLKGQGVKAGVSDLFLAIPRIGNNIIACGLWMEVKTQKGKITEEQAAWFNRMLDVKYAFIVVRSVDDGIQAIKNYLGIKS
jgi:hypothetical protein